MVFRATICYSHSRSVLTQSTQKKPSRTSTRGVRDTVFLQVSFNAFSVTTRYLVSLRIRFTVYRYVSLPTVGSYLYVEPIFRPNIYIYILFDSSGISFYRSDNNASIVIILDCVLTRCMVNEAPTLIFDQVSDLPFPLSRRLPLNLMSFIFTFILPVISVTLDNTAFLSAGKFVEVGPAHILQAPTKLSGKTSAEPHDVANFVH